MQPVEANGGSMRRTCAKSICGLAAAVSPNLLFLILLLHFTAKEDVHQMDRVADGHSRHDPLICRRFSDVNQQ